MANTCEAPLPTVEFWDFALAVYGKENVRQQLLLWQDEHGANVNLALLCVWAGLRDRRLSAAQLRTALAAAAGWHAAATQPLRELRRRLKADWKELAIDAKPARQAVLAAELEAEKAEQVLFLHALAPWPPAQEPQTPSIAEANLRTYLGSAATAAPASIIAAICSAE